MRLGKVYCLKDPFNLDVRYVGFTRTTISNRFSQHKHEALKKKTLSHCYNWFRECYDKGNLPIIEILEDGIPLTEWETKEQFWIDSFENLTNQKKGGCGVHLNTNLEGRIRSIDSKKKPIVQLNINGDFIKNWNSTIEAEMELIGEHTGNIYRAVRTKSTALNCLWVLLDQYDSTKEYLVKGKHWKKINLYCIYTKKLIKTFEKSSDLSNEMKVVPSIINQCIINNNRFKEHYYLRYFDDVGTIEPPKPNKVYLCNGNYYMSFNKLYYDEKLPLSLGYQKQYKSQFLVENITEDIVRSLKEISR